MSTVSAPPDRLMNRNFFLLWQGQLVSRLGDQAFLIAMMFWTKEATGSSSIMGVLMMVSLLPGAILSPLGGTFADRHSRYWIIVGGDVLRGLAAVALAVLMFASPNEIGWILVALVVVTVNGGVVGSLFMPAIHASLPDLVPRSKVAAANSLNRLSSQGAVFLGQAAGGVLYRLVGAPLLFLLDGISFLLSALSEGFLHIPQELPRKGTERTRGLKGLLTTYLHETRDGLSWVWGDTGMRTFLLTTAVLNFFFSPLMVLLPFYVTDLLGRGAEWYGFLLAAMGAGSMVGYVTVGWFPPEGSARVKTTVGALTGAGLAAASVGLVETGWLALALFFGFGVLLGIVNILVFTLFQIATPGEMRGRVMGLVMAMSTATMPVGMAVSGLVGDLTDQNLPLIFGVSGATVTAVSLWAASRPPFRRFLRQEMDARPSPPAPPGPESAPLTRSPSAIDPPS